MIRKLVLGVLVAGAVISFALGNPADVAPTHENEKAIAGQVGLAARK